MPVWGTWTDKTRTALYSLLVCNESSCCISSRAEFSVWHEENDSYYVMYEKVMIDSDCNHL